MKLINMQNSSHRLALDTLFIAAITLTIVLKLAGIIDSWWYVAAALWAYLLGVALWWRSVGLTFSILRHEIREWRNS